MLYYAKILLKKNNIFISKTMHKICETGNSFSITNQCVPIHFLSFLVSCQVLRKVITTQMIQSLVISTFHTKISQLPVQVLHFEHRTEDRHNLRQSWRQNVCQLKSKQCEQRVNSTAGKQSTETLGKQTYEGHRQQRQTVANRWQREQTVVGKERVNGSIFAVNDSYLLR